MTEMLEWSGKDFKAALIKMSQQAIINMLETSGKNRKSQQRTRRYNKDQNEILEQKNIISEISG